MWAAGIFPLDEEDASEVPEFCRIVKKFGRLAIPQPFLHWLSQMVPRVSDAGCPGQSRCQFYTGFRTTR